MDGATLRRAVRNVLAELGDRLPAPTGAPAVADDVQPLWPDPAAAGKITPPSKIALGCDHGGIELKDFLRDALRKEGYIIVDLGCHSGDSVDYPDYAFKVADLVARAQTRVGIMVDGVGIGSCMAANKVPGVRAAPCYEAFAARNSREHNGANVLCLGGRVTGSLLALAIVKDWLATPFGGGRHGRRVGKIAALEKRFARGQSRR